MSGRRWTEDELDLVELHRGRFRQSVTAEMTGRTENAVRNMASRVRKERERVEAARNSRDVSRETVIAASIEAGPA